MPTDPHATPFALFDRAPRVDFRDELRAQLLAELHPVETRALPEVQTLHRPRRSRRRRGLVALAAALSITIGVTAFVATRDSRPRARVQTTPTSLATLPPIPDAKPAAALGLSGTTTYALVNDGTNLLVVSGGSTPGTATYITEVAPGTGAVVRRVGPIANFDATPPLALDRVNLYGHSGYVDLTHATSVAYPSNVVGGLPASVDDLVVTHQVYTLGVVTSAPPINHTIVWFASHTDGLYKVDITDRTVQRIPDASNFPRPSTRTPNPPPAPLAHFDALVVGSTDVMQTWVASLDRDSALLSVLPPGVIMDSPTHLPAAPVDLTLIPGDFAHAGVVYRDRVINASGLQTEFTIPAGLDAVAATHDSNYGDPRVGILARDRATGATVVFVEIWRNDGNGGPPIAAKTTALPARFDPSGMRGRWDVVGNSVWVIDPSAPKLLRFALH